jgi:carbonic anhydrase
MLSFVVASSILAINISANNTVSATNPTTTVDWDYKKNGSDWNYPLCKEGKKQSPINLLMTAPLNDVIRIVGYNYIDFKVE